MLYSSKKKNEYGEISLNIKLPNLTEQKENPSDEINEENVTHSTKQNENILETKDFLDVNGLVPIRKITRLKWTGPILEIKGYFYFESIPILNEDFVRKTLLLVNENNEYIAIPLKDISIDELELGKDDKIDPIYRWAGFIGKVNFSTLDNGKPLPEATYKVLIKLEILNPGKEKYEKIFPLGNIEKFLIKGFHSTKMEYFSAKKELKYNLLATYDPGAKTLKIKSHKLKDFDPTIMSLDKSGKRSIFYKAFEKIGFRILYYLFCLLPLNKKKVVFASDSRTELSGNFKFVYDEMIRRNLDFEYHFMLKSTIREKKTIFELIQLAYHLATSKFIFLDDFYPIIYPLRIRKNAELVQLWHAVGAFKTFGYSRIGLPGGPKPNSKHHRNYTKAIVSSKSVAKYYAEGFGIDEEKVIATGVPRTDVFFDKKYQEQVRQELYEQFPFLRNKKVIMFAPTFRGNGQASAHYPMDVIDMGKLYKALKDEYVFLFKIHPFVKNDWSIPYQYSDFFYDFSDYREINDLLFITDILITDYSSVCFEFALLNKPMLFFAFDVEEYVEKRDFYFDYHSFIPGPLVRTTEEIIKTIKEQNYQMEKIKPFIHYFYDHFDGKSSQRVVDHIIFGNDESTTNNSNGKITGSHNE